MSLILVFLFAACVQSLPLPDVGPCADYPEGVYEYGQIGIGNCLAGPTELHFVDGEDGENLLLVTNANPYQVFTGGSLLTIPWDGLDTSVGRNTVTDLGAVAHPLPDFAAGLATQGDLGMVTVRFSEDARVRQHFDDVHLVDLADPLAPKPSTRGTGGGSTVQVQSDPVDVVVDPASGYAFVANRTSHSISVLDASGEEVKVIQPWPEWTLTSARFRDRDASGSTAELALLSVNNRNSLTDEFWRLTWIPGSWRLWLPESGADTGSDGLRRYDHQGGTTYTPNALGTELDPTDTDGLVSAVRDPAVLASAARMFFTDGGAIRAASSGAFLGDWAFEVGTVWAGEEGDWDADPGGASPLVDPAGSLWVFFDGGGSDSASSAGIGAVSSVDGVSFQPVEGNPLLTPGRPHDAAGMADPHIVYDVETDLWRMYYGAWDGSRWTIGHAWSEDLLTWTASDEPVLALDGIDAAAPMVSDESGSWRMWYSRRDAGEWVLAQATSSDGTRWVDQGVLDDTADWAWTGDDPPGVALESAPNGSFRVEGDAHGQLGGAMVPGFGYVAAGYGWRALAVTGHQLGPGDAGPASNGGIRIDAADEAAGLAWLTLTSSGGVPRIGAATLEDDGAVIPVDGPLEGAWFEGTGGFDRDGVSSPAVVEIGGTYHLFYAGQRGATLTVGHATSADGLTWTRQGSVLGTGASGSFDAVAVEPGSIEVLGDGSIRLWYSGFDGDVWRIGTAVAATPGAPFVREPGPTRAFQFATGAPGDWDDSGVRHPWIVQDPTGTHLWYAGSDGSTWRLGHALRPSGEDEFARAADIEDLPRPIMDPLEGSFEPDGVFRPVILAEGSGWRGWYTGRAAGEDRIGGLYGFDAARLNRVTRPPTSGDVATFQTERGDPNANAIPLDTSLPDADILGVGLHGLTLDAERGMLYAVSKLAPFVVVIDIRDDSGVSFRDLNYLDVEAVLLFATSSGGDGFRQVVPVAGTDRLYGLNDSPEAVWVMDIADLRDDASADLLYETVVGYLPTPRGRERDDGADSQMSIGPAQMALHPDGRRLFVTNFNTNSVSVYDLALGPYGQELAEVRLVGENPYAIALSPDGTQAVFANYTGEVSASGLAESTLGVLDIDPDSPTYLQVVTWVANR